MSFLTTKILKTITNASGHSANNMKRFYKQSTFKLNDKPPHPMHKYLINLDNKGMKTPYRNTLAVPSKAIALMITNEFNRQDKLMKTIQMPILSLSRTAVDADIEGHLAQHLKHTIFQYLKTDTILFYQNREAQRYQKLVQPLITSFNKKFNMDVHPSDTLEPPVMQFSKQFLHFIHSLNNWQLIGLETMVIWMKSSISAISIVTTDLEPTSIQQAAYLQELIQMQHFGQVQQKIMDINQIRLMVSAGEMLYRLSRQ